MKNALFIGRSVIDVISLVDHYPDPNQKIVALDNDVITGGSALNAAITFSHFGGGASLATSVGASDPLKEIFLSDLSQYKVELHNINKSNNYQIPISTIISTKSSGARMIVNNSQKENEDVESLPDLFNSNVDLIQLDQYERYFVFKNKEFLKKYEGPIILDGGDWKEWSLDYLRLSTIPIVSDVFFPKGISEFEKLCNDLNIRRWAITRGSKGVYYYDEGKKGEIDPIKITPIDTMGAGDIFHGAFCYFFLNNFSFLESLQNANEIAAKSCVHVGTRGWMNA